MQALAARLGIADRLSFHGFQTQRQLRPLFERADLLVMSSRHEAGPIAVLEAAVIGVPTVGTAVGHIREWAPRAALAVPVGDAAALARAMHLLLTDETLRLDMAWDAHAMAGYSTPAGRPSAWCPTWSSSPRDPPALNHALPAAPGAARGAGDIHPGGAAATALLLHRLSLRAGDRVLELGCGTGATLLRTAQALPLCIVGVDAMPEMLAAARQRVAALEPGRRPQLLAADIGRLPFASASFDRAYAESVLGMQDADRIVAALGELRRVLKPGATCVINDAIWNATASAAVIATANARCEQEFGLRQASREPWRLADWQAAMRRSGFEVRSSELLAMRLRPHAMQRLHHATWRGLRRVGAAWQAFVAPAADPEQRRYARALWRQRRLGRLVEARLFELVRS